ncbi:amino acid ABC transporter permease [Clostridium putrefaciens]|uniref:Amino acid ABC transporter permease n=1 Tax=Clostridium putrefaciens TaxID=99675 RepID=A0A381JB46_9CLOT|nr:APC family permease [Clostridium putrefaciens]SUY47617.1 amino acid ABC transporter permease [Clostridium putrefaciens]
MRKKLNKIDILTLALGSIIGWGSFTLPGSKFLHESGIISTAIGLILGGFAIIFIQKGYHIMMERHHEDGGEFSYTYKNLGKANGFVVGWSLTLCYISMVPLNATAFVLVIKKLFGAKVDFIYLYKVAGYPVYLSEIIIASLIILVFAYINTKGLGLSSMIQNILILLMVINVIIVFAFMIINTDHSLIKDTYIINYKLNIAEVAKVFSIVPFLFVGFDVIPQVSTELNFEAPKATRIAIIAIFAGVLFYNLLNITTGLVYTKETALLEEWALGSAVLDNMGYLGFMLLIISLAGAVAGGINGFMLGSSKLIGALSIYGLIPTKYKKKNHEGVFQNGVKFVVLISLIAPWFGREAIIYIVDMSSLLSAIAYFYVCYIGFKNSKGSNSYLSAFGALISLVFVGLLIIPGSPGRLSRPSMILTVLWGILGYLYYRRYSKIMK